VLIFIQSCSCYFQIEFHTQMYAVENYGKDSLSRVTICYMMNSMTGNLNSYLSLYCEEEANYSQYFFIFNVLIPFLKMRK
jgi:hypothetical protein